LIYYALRVADNLSKTHQTTESTLQRIESNTKPGYYDGQLNKILSEIKNRNSNTTTIYLQNNSGKK